MLGRWCEKGEADLSRGERFRRVSSEIGKLDSVWRDGDRVAGYNTQGVLDRPIRSTIVNSSDKGNEVHATRRNLRQGE